MSNLWNSITNFVSENAGTICAVVATVCCAGTTILAIKETPKALEDIENEVKRINEQIDRQNEETMANCPSNGQVSHVTKLTKKQIIKTVWKRYIKVAIALIATISFIVACDRLHIKKERSLMLDYTAAMTSYKAATDAYKLYKNVTEKVMTDDQKQEVKEKIVEAKKEKAKATIVYAEDPDIVMTGEGNTLFYEPISKQLLYTSREAIDRHINNLNWRMSYCNEPYVSVNDMLEEFGLEEDYYEGESKGWRPDHALISVSTNEVTVIRNKPCFVIEWNPYPMIGHSDLHG